MIVFVHPALAQTPDSLFSPDSLKRLSLEQLMDVEVTSVSRRPEKLSITASAIQIITGEDIRRSGASSIAEALRLAPNLQVAQVNASQWAVSARGFNNVLANKLLVPIDGRIVYTPLYAGVFWDVQNPPLESVDRIEVVSGPGGALWGANAINGVINIITKNAGETQGLSVEGGAGTELQGFGAVRYGGRTPTAAPRSWHGTAMRSADGARCSPRTPISRFRCTTTARGVTSATGSPKRVRPGRDRPGRRPAAPRPGLEVRAQQLHRLRDPAERPAGLDPDGSPHGVGGRLARRQNPGAYRPRLLPVPGTVGAPPDR